MVKKPNDTQSTGINRDGGSDDDDDDDSLSRELLHYAVEKGSKNGEENGLEIMLDIENFNFAYHRVSSQGLKVAVHDHRQVTYNAIQSKLHFTDLDFYV